ncbi:MAG: outer membrane protein assembly factor BamA [Hyphomonadaceae bacterium]|nr:outer membrane protein assembly factor BamA [Hyphomonadaceae bacterium]
MKRVLRDVMVGAVTGVAAVSASVLAAQPAIAQDAAPAPQASPPPAAPPAAQPPAADAARPAPVQPGLAIRRILVEGNQRVESSTVTSYMLLRPGDVVDPERVDLSLKTLFATGLFADVQIGQRDADLVVRVVENPIVNRVVFEGLNALDEEDLNKEVQAKPRSVFTPARAQADVQRIIELYRRAGRFAATVTPQVRELEQNRVDLIFEVDEGPVTGVRSINIIGNKEFSDRELREAVLTEESKWWRFFARNDNYDPDRLEYDRELLRQFYTNRGFADFRVISATAELTPDQKDFFITFTIDEGIKYDFGEVTVETELDRVPADLLRAVIPIRTGQLFEGELIEKSIDAMTFTAGTGGYANVDIRPRIERDTANQKVNLVFEVNEGPRVFVERIDIVGNTRTLDQVVRRELRVSEGDAFNRVLLDRSRARIRALGFFKSVEIEEREGSEPDRAIVEVKVEEDTTGELAFAAGFSSTDNFLFDVSVSERNLRGRGQFVRLRASTSSRRQQVDIRFTEPRFMGRDLAAGVDLFTLRTDYLDESSFENQSTGFGLRASFPITDTTGMGLTYTLRIDDTEVADLLVDLDGDFTTVNDLVDQCSRAVPITQRPLLCDQEGEFLTSVFGYAFNWDRRNDPIDPTRGFDLSVRQDFAGLGGDVKYFRTEVEGGTYYGLFPDVVASFSLSAGYVAGWGDEDVRINDRFFKGGSSFRGFDVAGIGPRQLILSQDSTNPGQVDIIEGDALGGNAYYIGSFQLTVPTGLPKEYGISGALFAEFGGLGVLDPNDRRRQVFTSGTTTFTSYVDDALSLRASAGVSIFWDSPFGPVQFDFAQPFAREEYDETESFRFSTRTRF